MGFTDVANDQAYLKAGILGLQGSGKTTTAAIVAIGLHKMLADKGLPGGTGTVWMLDTEVGSSWLKKRFSEAGITLKVNKTRAFKDLVDGVNEVADHQGILLIDSITHYWMEVCQAYCQKNKRKAMTFQDWGNVKAIWRDFTDAYVNSPSHILMCGRQGYEYDFFEDDAGRKQLEKTALKMKGEGETGYEPSLLIAMERHQQLGSNGSVDKVWRSAFVLKDRADVIDGKEFKDPTFENFLPHIDCLNLGGDHVGVDTSRNSEDMIERQERGNIIARQREIMLEEIEGVIKKKYPGQSAADKEAKASAIEQVFQTRSWAKVSSYSLTQLKDGYKELCVLFGEVPLSSGEMTVGELENVPTTTAPSKDIPF